MIKLEIKIAKEVVFTEADGYRIDSMIGTFRLVIRSKDKLLR